MRCHFAMNAVRLSSLVLDGLGVWCRDRGLGVGD